VTVEKREEKKDMSTCKDCGAPMIPGVMSEGWCSAECDLRKEKKEYFSGTGLPARQIWRSLCSPDELIADGFIACTTARDRYTVVQRWQADKNFVSAAAADKHCYHIVSGEVEDPEKGKSGSYRRVVLPIGTVLEYIEKREERKT